MSKVIRLNDDVLSLLDRVRGVVAYNLNDCAAVEVVCGSDLVLLEYVLNDYLTIREPFSPQ